MNKIEMVEVGAEEAKDFAVKGAVTLAKVSAVLLTKVEDPGIRKALSLIIDGALTLGDAVLTNTIPMMPEGITQEEANQLHMQRAEQATGEMLMMIALGF